MISRSYKKVPSPCILRIDANPLSGHDDSCQDTKHGSGDMGIAITTARILGTVAVATSLHVPASNIDALATALLGLLAR